MYFDDVFYINTLHYITFTSTLHYALAWHKITVLFYLTILYLSLTYSFVNGSVLICILNFQLHPLTTTAIAPMAILIILNRRILKGMRVLNNSRRGPAQPQEEQQFVNNAAAERSQRRHMNEIRATQMAIAIVISFVVLNLPRIAISFKEVTNTNLILFCIENKTGFYNSVEYFQIDVVARMFMMVNSAINFVIYSAVSHPFQVNYSSYCSWYQCKDLQRFYILV